MAGMKESFAMEDYLRSVAAVEDVTAWIDRPAGPFQPKRDVAIWWKSDSVGPWYSVTLQVGQAQTDAPLKWVEWTVYFRLERMRYIVTDLGDGIRELRRRTGKLWQWNADPFSFLPEDRSVDLLDRFMVCKVNVAGEYFCAEAIVPAAICGVMLASYRIAHMEG